MRSLSDQRRIRVDSLCVQGTGSKCIWRTNRVSRAVQSDEYSYYSYSKKKVYFIRVLGPVIIIGLVRSRLTTTAESNHRQLGQEGGDSALPCVTCRKFSFDVFFRRSARIRCRASIYICARRCQDHCTQIMSFELIGRNHEQTFKMVSSQDWPIQNLFFLLFLSPHTVVVFRLLVRAQSGAHACEHFFVHNRHSNNMSDAV